MSAYLMYSEWKPISRAFSSKKKNTLPLSSISSPYPLLPHPLHLIFHANIHLHSTYRPSHSFTIAFFPARKIHPSHHHLQQTYPIATVTVLLRSTALTSASSLLSAAFRELLTSKNNVIIFDLDIQQSIIVC